MHEISELTGNCEPKSVKILTKCITGYIYGNEPIKKRSHPVALVKVTVE